MSNDFPTFIVNGSLYAAGGDHVNCTLSVCPVEASVYGYRASLPFSSLLIALYAICLVVQVVLGWHYKTWGYLSAMALGCLVEILGYVGRIIMWNNPWNNGGFIMQIGMSHASESTATRADIRSAYNHRTCLLQCSHIRHACSDVCFHCSNLEYCTNEGTAQTTFHLQLHAFDQICSIGSSFHATSFPSSYKLLVVACHLAPTVVRRPVSTLLLLALHSRSQLWWLFPS